MNAVFTAPASTLSPLQRAELPRAFIVDLDGTLCLHNGRDPYDESGIPHDVPDPAVLAVTRAMYRDGHQVLFTSGRRERTRQPTCDWLDRHLRFLPGGRLVVPYRLFMRPDTDTRNDALVKFDMYREHIHDRYAITAVFDDRDRVVSMWRAVGLKCMQVAPGDF